MRRFRIPALAAAAVLLLFAGSLSLRAAVPNAQATHAPTVGVGGQLSFGTPTVANGKVVIPIRTTAPVDPYTGFEVNVIFDTTQFIYFGNDGAANGVFAGQQNLCLAAPSPQPSPPGEVVSCTPVGAPSNSAAGEFIQLQFTPTGSAVCSKFHLYTLNGPDNGDSNTGSYSIDYAAQQPQLNTYGPDITVDQAAATGCTPPTAATNTPAVTNTPTQTGTATQTPTNTATPIGGLRTVTPSPTVGTPAAPTTAPGGGQATTAPGGGPGGANGQPTSPGGGPGGVSTGPTGNVRLPNTGNSGADGGWNVTLITLGVVLILAAAATTGGAAVLYRRRAR